MQTSHVYLEVGFPVKNEFSFVHAWIRCTNGNKEAVKSFFQYKLGNFSVLDDATQPPSVLKQFIMIVPIDHNLADILASAQNGDSFSESDAIELKDGEPTKSEELVIPSLTLGMVSGECEEEDFPYLEEFVKNTFVSDPSSPIPLDHYAVEIKALEEMN